MADINVDVDLPNAINVDITSPTQALATNISIPGPQGPRGPGSNINNLTPDLFYITGKDGIIVSSNGIDIIYVSGNSGYFQSAVNSLTTNLNLTGANLNTSINILSGLFTGHTGSLDTNYATEAELASTGLNLNNKINSLSGYSASAANLAITGSNLYTLITNFSGNLDADFASQAELNSLSGYVNSQDTSISNNLTSTGSSLDNKINSLSGWSASAANLASTGATLITNLFNTGSNLNTKIDNLSGYINSQDNNISNNLTSTGSTLISSINSLNSAFTGFTGNLDANYATDLQLYNTGSTLDTKINSLSGNLTSNYETIINVASTGSTLNTKINNLSGYVNTQDTSISNNLASTGSTLQSNINTLTNNLNSTGSSLDNKIGSLSGTLTSNYATIVNLASTGSTLNSNIISLSGLFTGYTGTLDDTFASDIQLANTGSTLVTSINSLSGTLTGNYLTTNSASNTYATINNLANTGSTLDTKINTLSGSSVLLYGNQTISGLKDFTTRPTVNTTPVLLSGENAHGLTVLVKNNDSVTLNKGQPVYIYGANGDNILVRRAMNTGEATSSKTLGLLNQSLAPNAQGLVVTEGGLEGIDTNAGNAGDPIWLGPTGDLIFGLANKPYAPNHLVYLGVIERKQQNNGKIYVKVQNGFELQELHNVNIDHKNALNNNDILRYNSASGLWFNETLNTGIFQTQINSLSGSSVLLYGNQSIGGVKTFRDNVYINNLFVTGTETIVSTNNFNVQSPYILLNLTGGAVDGGIFFVTGAGLTGINDSGPIIGFDHSNKFKFGVTTRNSDLSTLPDIASVQDITTYSGFVDGKYSTIINLASTGSALSTNLASTGSTLQTNINNLSNTYATITNLGLTGSTLVTNLASTGSTLDTKINTLSGYVTGANSTFTANLATTGSTLNTKINNLSGYINSTSSNIVFTTGNQTISGTKTFANNIQVSGNDILIAPANYIYITGNQTSIVNGTKYVADTRSGLFGFNLPASPSTGNYLEFADPFYSWSGNNFILSGNGNNIEGDNSPFTGDAAGLSMKSVFVGGIYGWRIV
jgi:hypothetical protein